MPLLNTSGTVSKRFDFNKDGFKEEVAVLRPRCDISWSTDVTQVGPGVDISHFQLAPAAVIIPIDTPWPNEDVPDPKDFQALVG